MSSDFSPGEHPTPPTPRGRLSSRPARLGALAGVAVLFALVGFLIAHFATGTTSANTTPTTSPSASARPPVFSAGAPAETGVVTTVDTAADHFTMTTRSGSTVTVDVTSSTTYRTGTSASSLSKVVSGARVAVYGTVSGTTVTAKEVLLIPAGSRPFGGAGLPGGSGRPGTFGSVTSIDRTADTFVVRSFSGTSVTVDVSSSTTFTQFSGATGASGATGSTASSLASLATGDRVSVSGTVSGSTVKATRVVILPTDGFGSGRFGGSGGGFGGGGFGGGGFGGSGAAAGGATS
jgi:hypothetical protein